MARPFNLTAQLNIQGPAGIRTVVSKLKRELSSVKADLQVKIDPKAARSAGNLNKQIQALDRSLTSASAKAAKLAASINSAASGMSKLGTSSKTTASGVDNLGKSTESVGKQLGIARTEMEEFGRVSGLALRRFAGFTIASAAVFGFVRAVQDGVGASISFERELTKIAQVTGRSIESLAGLSKEIRRVATDFGVASSELVEVSRILTQAGLSANDTRIALEALGKSTLAPTFTDIKNTTEGAIAAMSQFGITAGQLEGVLGSINAVAGNFAVEADDIISVIRRTGGVFKAASGDISAPATQLNELAAIFTSVRATTRESSESIATGLRTIFTRIQRPRTIEFLRQFGVELQDSEGKFIGAFNAVERLSEGLRNLDPRDVRFSQIVEEIGGFRQVGKLIPAITQFSTAQEALKVAQQGSGSIARDAATAQEALAVQIAKVREEFLELVDGLARTGTFQTVTSSILKVASSLIKLTDSIKPVLPLLTAFAAIRGIGAARQFGAGFFGGLRSGGGAAGAGAGLAGVATGAGSQAVTQSSNALASVQKSLITASNANTAAIKALTVAVKTARLGGGPARRFASGGLVPGSGNRDTVPAMLTPGEFVIRKSSVNKYGTSMLSGLNNPQRFANGSSSPVGTIFRDFDSEGRRLQAVRKTKGAEFQKGALAKTAKTFIKVGGAFLRPAGVDRDIKGKIPVTAFGQNKKAVKGILGTGSSVNFQITSASLDREDEVAFEDALEDSLFNVSTNFAKSTLGQLRAGFDSTKFRSELRSNSKFNFPQVSGNIFEAAISAAQAPFDNQKIRGNAPFDFPAGLGSLAEKFDPDLAGIPTDAKRTFGVDSIQSLIGKIKQIVVENATQGVDKEGQPTFFAQNDPFTRRASGGSIPRKGSDSIPALLTPGEFVMSRDASKNIGVNTLRALNKGTFKGFANGGFVQRFANGSRDLASFERLSPANQRFFTDKFGRPGAGGGQLNLSAQQTTAAMSAVTRSLQQGADTQQAYERGQKAAAMQQQFNTKSVIESTNRIKAEVKSRTVLGRAQLRTVAGFKRLSSGLTSSAKNLKKSFGSDRLMTAAFLLPSAIPESIASTPIGAGVQQGAMQGILAGTLTGRTGVGVVAGLLGGLQGFLDAAASNKAAAALTELNLAAKDLQQSIEDLDRGVGSLDAVRAGTAEVGLRAQTSFQAELARRAQANALPSNVGRIATVGLLDAFSGRARSFGGQRGVVSGLVRDSADIVNDFENASKLFLQRSRQRGFELVDTAAAFRAGTERQIQAELAQGRTLFQADPAFRSRIQREGRDLFGQGRTALDFDTLSRLSNLDLPDTIPSVVGAADTGVDPKLLLDLVRTSAEFQTKVRPQFQLDLAEAEQTLTGNALVQRRTEIVKEFNTAVSDILEKESRRLDATDKQAKAVDAVTKGLELATEQFKTMNQVLNVTDATVKRNIDLEKRRIDLLTGASFKIDLSDDKFINLLKNPRAFSSGEFKRGIDELEDVLGFAGGFRSTKQVQKEQRELTRVKAELSDLEATNRIQRNRAIGIAAAQNPRLRSFPFLVDQSRFGEGNIRTPGTEANDNFNRFLVDFVKSVNDASRDLAVDKPFASLTERTQSITDTLRDDFQDLFRVRGTPGAGIPPSALRANTLQSAVGTILGKDGQPFILNLTEALDRNAAIEQRSAENVAKFEKTVSKNSVLTNALLTSRQAGVLERELPSILATAIERQRGISGEGTDQVLQGEVVRTIGDEVAEALLSDRFTGAIDADTARKIGDAIGTLTIGRQFKPEEALDNIVSKVGKKFEAANATTVRFLESLNKALDGVANSINKEVELRQKLSDIQLRQVASAATAQALIERAQGQVGAGRNLETGRFVRQIGVLTRGRQSVLRDNTGITDLLPSDARSAFESRSATLDPREIQSRLQANRQAILSLEELQRKVTASAAVTGNGAETSNQLATELSSLVSESANLQKALELAADGSLLFAKVQADVAQRERDRAGAGSLLERLLKADRDTVKNIVQGATVFRQVQADPSASEGLSREQRSAALEFVNLVGQAQGKEIGDRFRQVLLRGLAGDAVTGAGRLGGNVDLFQEALGNNTASTNRLTASIQAAFGVQTEANRILQEQQRQGIDQSQRGRFGILSDFFEGVRRIQNDINPQGVVQPEGFGGASPEDSADLFKASAAEIQSATFTNVTITNLKQRGGPEAGAGAGLGRSTTDVLNSISQFVNAVQTADFITVAQSVETASKTLSDSMDSFNNNIASLQDATIELRISPDSAINLTGDSALGEALAAAIQPRLAEVVEERIAAVFSTSPDVLGGGNRLA